MRKSELDRLLETAVAEALGLAPRRPRKAKPSIRAPRGIRPSYPSEQHAAH